MGFKISRDSVQCQALVILMVCLYGLGAYFVYDAPAAIQSYLMAGTGMTSEEYMRLYSWYSAPSVVTCILGGILIDQIFGMRLSGIIFCLVLTTGQALYAYAIGFNVQGDTFWRYMAALGRGVTGSGVEAIAVCCNCYISQWAKPSLKPLAFGIAISAWRLSSTINLNTMSPFYENINEVTPQDGTTEVFSTCVMRDCSGGIMSGENGTNFDLEKHTGNYYCYDADIQSACNFAVGDHAKFITGDNSFCSSLKPEMEDFMEKTEMRKSGCFKQHEGKFDFHMDVCECIDPYFYPTKEWANKMRKEEAVHFDEELMSHYEVPFYWLDSFGESRTGDAFIEKYEKVKEFKDKICESNFGLQSVPIEKYDSMADIKKVWRNINNDPVAKKAIGVSDTTDLSEIEIEDYVQRQERAAILNPVKLNAKTVVAVVKKLNSPNIYARDCNGAILSQIPEEDTEARLSAATSVYYFMILVCLFSCGCACGLFYIDREAEKDDIKKNPELAKPKEKKKLDLKEQIGLFLNAWKQIPLTVWVLFVMCICFYVGVFTWVAQAPMFFEKHTGVAPNVARLCASLVYLLAVMMNPVMGAVVSTLRHEQLFLTSAYVLNGLAHFLMLTVKGTIASFVGPFLLALAYAIIGSTIWVLPSVLVKKEIQGQVFGLMFALQNLGLTVGADTAGYIRDHYGWLTLETFFIALQIVGAVLSLYIIKEVGISIKRDSDEDGLEEEEKETLTAAKSKYRPNRSNKRPEKNQYEKVDIDQPEKVAIDQSE